jgi:hypothetical protein
MTATVPIDSPSVAKPVSRQRSRKPATVSAGHVKPQKDLVSALDPACHLIGPQ